MATSNPFSAIDASLGYLYQVRAGLLWSLQRLRRDEPFLVSIESVDDVAFESLGDDPSVLLQTKHHASRTATLTDASPDIWKTLRVWIEGSVAGIVPPHSSLCLVTTGTAPAGSAANMLRMSERNVSAARGLLDATARTSSSATNASAYVAYEAMSPAARDALLERVIVIDAAPTVSDLNDSLRTEVFWAVDRNHQDSFLDRLEGWWLRRVILQLTGAPGDRIGSVEIEAQMAELRDQFRQDSLPIDADLLDFELDEATEHAHAEHLFVKQIEIIAAGKRRVANAIRDYYRAYEQRSRWLREDLVVGLDLRRYERRLMEEWAAVFEAMRDELGTDATDVAKLAAARTVLTWAERASCPIRPGVTEPFLCKGSLHMISDEGRIGWHPEFQGLLADLIVSGRGSA
jgi:hypothetical protein